LLAAQEKAAAASKKVNTETLTYNRMLRAGVSREALAAQLARINGSEKERDAALAAEKAAGRGRGHRQVAD